MITVPGAAGSCSSHGPLPPLAMSSPSLVVSDSFASACECWQSKWMEPSIQRKIRVRGRRNARLFDKGFNHLLTSGGVRTRAKSTGKSNAAHDPQPSATICDLSVKENHAESERERKKKRQAAGIDRLAIERFAAPCRQLVQRAAPVKSASCV